MSNDKPEMIGKPVKDMYGAVMGKVVGTITDIDGSTQTVGINCGSNGLQQVPFEQLVVQGDVVIYIPKWRLDSQRLLREKGLTLRRLKAMIDIVSENDEMKEDAEVVHEKYKSKLVSLDEFEAEIKAKLDARLAELDEQEKLIRTVEFDAKLQCKSNEISESVFESVKKHTTEFLEHVTHEKAEISSMHRRIADLNAEVQEAISPQQKPLQTSAETYLVTNESTQTTLPEAPTHAPIQTSEPASETETHPEIPIPPSESEAAPIPEPPQQVTAETSEKPEEQSDWLSRMEAS